jgi:hypothetical protein
MRLLWKSMFLLSGFAALWYVSQQYQHRQLVEHELAAIARLLDGRDHADGGDMGAMRSWEEVRLHILWHQVRANHLKGLWVPEWFDFDQTAPHEMRRLLPPLRENDPFGRAAGLITPSPAPPIERCCLESPPGDGGGGRGNSAAAAGAGN